MSLSHSIARARAKGRIVEPFRPKLKNVCKIFLFGRVCFSVFRRKNSYFANFLIFSITENLKIEENGKETFETRPRPKDRELQCAAKSECASGTEVVDRGKLVGVPKGTVGSSLNFPQTVRFRETVTSFSTKTFEQRSAMRVDRTVAANFTASQQSDHGHTMGGWPTSQQRSSLHPAAHAGSW